MNISHQRVAGFLFEMLKLLMALFVLKPSTYYPDFSFFNRNFHPLFVESVFYRLQYAIG